MLNIIIYGFAVITLLIAAYSIKKKLVVLGCFLIVAASGMVIYNFLNPAPRNMDKVVIVLDESLDAATLPDSLFEAAYQAEQLLSLEPDMSVLSLKNAFKAVAGKHVTADSLRIILEADYLLKISLSGSNFKITINDSEFSANSISELKKILINEFSLSETATLGGSSPLKQYFRNLLLKRDSLNIKLPVNTLTIGDRYNLISRQDSSKNRNRDLNALLMDLDKTADYWWKKSGLKIRILLSLGNYYEAFRIVKAQHSFLADQPEYYYLLSKFSYNRFKELGYSTKFEIRDLAKGHIGADLDMMAELAETFYLDGFNADAESLYRVLIRIYPHTLSFRSQLGVVVSRLNRVEESAAIFRQCIKMDSTDWTVYYNLGIQYFWYDKSLAKPAFKKAVALGDTTNSLLFLGRLAFDEKQYDSALVYFRQRVRHETGRDDPNWLEALKGIRRCREKLKTADSLKISGAQTK